MRIGQIVYIKDSRLKVQTGIVGRKEKDYQGEFWWYEVLCNDGQNHVLPGHLLSPATRGEDVIVDTKNKSKKACKNNAALYKYITQPVTLYT